MSRIFFTQGRSLLTSSRTSTRVALAGRSLHSSRRALDSQKVPQDTLSQGHATRKSGSAKDAQAEYVQSGMKDNKGDIDAASPDRDLKSRSLERDSDKSGGNPEGVGFADQVGSQSASADGASSGRREEHKDEEAATPGLFSTIKSKLGLGTDTGDVKQNRGGGHGVSGTGTTGLRGDSRNGSGQQQSRGLHSSASMDPGAVRGASPSDVRKQTLGTGKDRPSPVDYMSDVLRDTQRSTRPHNLGSRASHKVDDPKVISPDPLFDAEKTVSPPRRHPRTDAVRAAGVHADHDEAGKPSGEWSVAGHSSSEYRNVSVQEDPYEVPPDDTDAPSKEDSRAKKLRYGGLRTKPDLA